MNLKTIRSLFKTRYCNAEIDLEIYRGETTITMFLNNREIVSVTTPKENKKEIYSLLVTLMQVFDFSYHLEFNSVDELVSFIES